MKIGFKCASCNKFVTFMAAGTKNRNHCPFCLYSMHVDVIPGDRKETCRGLMAPIGVLHKKDGEEMLVHKCEKCSFLRKNRVAGDDSIENVTNLKVLNSNFLLDTGSQI